MLHELEDVYSAERQLVQALPVMAKKVTSDELRAAMEKHLKQTEEHVERLKRVFELLGVAPRSQRCKGMEGLIAEGRDLAEEDIEDDVLDAGLDADAGRRVHHGWWTRLSFLHLHGRRRNFEFQYLNQRSSC